MEHEGMGAPFFLPPEAAYEAVFGRKSAIFLDARRPEAVAASGMLLPAALMVDAAEGQGPPSQHDRARPVVVACVHGHGRSQRLAANLRREGFRASVLQGGTEAWGAAGLPMAAAAARGVMLGGTPTVWVTRRRPKIDRIACPWLVARFLDSRARFLFVEADQVLDVARAEGGVAYDLPGGLFEHEGPLCTFDILLREFGLSGWGPLAALAEIVRGADTDRLDLAPQAAGLLAVSLGLSARHGDDDHALLADGFRIYDGLLAWARQARGETHNWVRPVEGAAR
jgi:rhodanese-related sulfurtransferase